MQNQILHPEQPTRASAQVEKSIGTKIIESGANFSYVFPLPLTIFDQAL
jgi:hypothetical protein